MRDRMNLIGQPGKPAVNAETAQDNAQDPWAQTGCADDEWNQPGSAEQGQDESTEKKRPDHTPVEDDIEVVNDQELALLPDRKTPNITFTVYLAVCQAHQEGELQRGAKKRGSTTLGATPLAYLKVTAKALATVCWQSQRAGETPNTVDQQVLSRPAINDPLSFGELPGHSLSYQVWLDWTWGVEPIFHIEVYHNILLAGSSAQKMYFGHINLWFTDMTTVKVDELTPP
ncbi:hypothetical protein AB5N19_11378 [Seiridium cardinale]|uniref:Uncharacterized protein n=1 Tax=Seiridium cardinale TaxID=138064 RepID=A0ABR2XA52_9PEZI